MPICSYIVYPVQGKYGVLKNTLASMPYCEVMPADNQNILILVTDTDSNEEEVKLQQNLKQISEIQCLALTFGSVDKCFSKSGLDRPDKKKEVKG